MSKKRLKAIRILSGLLVLVGLLIFYGLYCIYIRPSRGEGWEKLLWSIFIYFTAMAAAPIATVNFFLLLCKPRSTSKEMMFYLVWSAQMIVLGLFTVSQDHLHLSSEFVNAPEPDHHHICPCCELHDHTSGTHGTQEGTPS